MADEVATMSSSPAFDFPAVAIRSDLVVQNAKCKMQKEHPLDARGFSEPAAFLAERVHFFRDDDVPVHVARQDGAIEDMKIVMWDAEHVPPEFRRQRQCGHRRGGPSSRDIPGARRGSRPAA